MAVAMATLSKILPLKSCGGSNPFIFLRCYSLSVFYR